MSFASYLLRRLLLVVPTLFGVTLISLALAVLIGVPLGILSAVHRDRLIDHIGRIVGVAGVAMPSFWTGLLLIYVFFYMLGIAPAPLGRLGSGLSPPTRLTGLYVVDSLLTGNWRTLGSSLAQLALPATTLAIGVMAPLARMVRATMLEILEADYIKAAWAAGLPRRRVIYD